MILQALNAYYKRTELAPAGWEYKEIPFIIEIDHNGNFVQLQNRTSAKNRRGHPMLVPQANVRPGTASWKKPQLLWDHYGFVLGEPKHKTNGELDPEGDPELTKKQFEAFIQRNNRLLSDHPNSLGLKAISSFYKKAQHRFVLNAPGMADVYRILGANMTFQLVGAIEPILHEPWVLDEVSASDSTVRPASGKEDGNELTAMCLVTGEHSIIARLHLPIKGVGPKPVPLAAANTNESPAYSSYHKHQGYNFPISKEAEFRYRTTLNHLLSATSRQRVDIGEAIAVFWAVEQHEMVDLFGEVLGDDPDRGTEALGILLRSAKTGKFSIGQSDAEFHMLGLAPSSKSRIAIRFYKCHTARALAQHLVLHFQDLDIGQDSDGPSHLSIRRLLNAVSRKTKDGYEVHPRLSGEFMEAIIDARPYPTTVLAQAIIRCRAEQAKRDKQSYQNVPIARAAVIKACLNRSIRRNNQKTTETETLFTPMLDPTNPNCAYRLGRLFATFEKVQEEANQLDGKLNATIRDKYYGAASSTPGTVFSTLIRLNKHHLSKLGKESKGLSVVREKLIQEIANGLNDFPAHLTLPDQARFALGYYHQRQALFTSTDKITEPTNN